MIFCSKIHHFTIILAGLLSCKASYSPPLRVDKYLDRDGFYSGPIKEKILQTNLYDDKCNLVIKKEYSRVGCNIVDSTVYSYDSNNRLIDKQHFTPIDIIDCKSQFSLRDHIGYRYNSRGELLEKNILKGFDQEGLNDSISKKNGVNYIEVKDSLQLLKDYLKDINLIISHVGIKDVVKTKSGSVSIYSYRFNDVPAILTDYGVPSNELLIAFTIYVEDEKLIKDKFQFENYSLTRTYSYKNDLIQNVSVENIHTNTKRKSFSTEYFISSGL